MKQIGLLDDSLSNEFSLIKDYYEYTWKFSESPQAFHLFTLFSTVSCVVGRNRFIQQGEDTIYPNLYVLIVAPSSLYMKSSSIGLLKKWLIRLQYMKGFIGHIGSPEGLFSALSENGGSAIGYYSELGVLLAQATTKKYMGETLEMLNDIYDCPDYFSRRLSQTLHRAENVCFNLLAASQMDSLSRYVKESDLLSGFLPRFFVVFSEARLPHLVRRPQPDKKLQNKILSQLNEIRISCQKDPGPMDLTPEAWETFETWAHEQWDRALSAPPQLQPMHGRMESHVLKLATIIELTRFSYSTEIDKMSLEMALDCAEFLMRGYRRLVMEELTFTVDERKLKKVSQIIKAARQIPHREVARATKYKDLKHILSNLHDMEKIRTIPGSKGGKVYEWIDLSVEK